MRSFGEKYESGVTHSAQRKLDEGVVAFWRECAQLRTF